MLLRGARTIAVLLITFCGSRALAVDPFVLSLQAGWRYETQRARIKRELEQAGRTLSGIEVVRDMKFARTRHILDVGSRLKTPFGISLSVDLPLVLSDSRVLSFDQDESPCIFPGGSQPATCVNESNSTVLNDAVPSAPNSNAPTILPGPLTPGVTSGFGLRGTGGAPALYGGGTRVFEGPSRAGIESLNLGLDGTIFDQKDEPSHPTWSVGIQGRIQVADTMAFSRAHPNGNTSVGLGYHVLNFHTFFEKRFRFLDPYVGLYYDLPIVTDSDCAAGVAFPNCKKAGSLGAASGTGQKHASPQHVAGATFGMTARLYERGERLLAVDLGGALTVHFEGRGWSEIWEMLACSKNDPAPFQSSLCFPPTDPFGVTALPGTSDIENYTTFGGAIGLRGRITRLFELRAGFAANHDQGHILTLTPAGKDKNGDGIVDPMNKEEYNPLHRQQTDLVGRRFRAEDSTTYRVTATANLAF